MNKALSVATWPARVTWAGMKQLRRLVFERFPSWAVALLPRTRYDYENEVGDGRRSTLIMAALNWAARNFPEAPLVVVRDQGGQEVRVDDHPLPRLIRRPNPYYAGTTLWMATIGDYMLTGNAYWAKVRARAGNVLQLWWLPSWTVNVVGGDSSEDFVTAYEYTVGGRVVRLDPKDVVHFRWGLDPDNPRVGVSQLRILAREVFSDDEAANFTASLLRNMAVPGVIIAPQDGADAMDAEQVARTFRAKFGGDNRGEAMVLTAPVKVERLTFSPGELDLRQLRRVPEERVAAVLGIPAIVLGFGSGLDRSTFANYAEAREAAYENFIIPIQRIIAEELEAQLLPEVGDESERVRFDLSKVRVLQEDEDKRAERHIKLVNGGLETLAEGRAALGLEVRPEHNVVRIPLNVMEVQVAGQRGQRELSGPVEAKARAVGAGREQRMERTARVLASYLRDLGERVAERLAGKERNGTERKLLEDDDLLRLEGILMPAFRESLRIASEQAAGIIDGHPLAEDSPLYLDVLRRMGERTMQLHQATKEAVQREVLALRVQGMSDRQIADQLREHFLFSEARAKMIARTEIAMAENWAASATWQSSGVTEVDVIDGEGCGWTAHDDPDIAHGSRRTLQEFDAQPLAHPNCRRLSVPVLPGVAEERVTGPPAGVRRT